MDLKNKTALVSGGSSGLGLEITKQLLAEEMKVFICARNEDNLKQTISEVNNSHLNFYVRDVTNADQVGTMANEIGSIDVLINNAGLWLEGELESNTYEKIAATINVNLTGTIFLTKAFVPVMKKKNDGFVINVGSTLSVEPRENLSVYVASKYGIKGFTDSLAKELAHTNIKVTGFYPGGMNNTFHAKAGNEKDHAAWMSPEEVAKAVLFILKRPENMIVDQIVIKKRASNGGE